MKKHIKEYMIHYTQLNNYLNVFNNANYYCFDTESCFCSEKIKSIYEFKTKESHNGDAVRIYAWALSNTSNDYVLYGENLEQFFDAIEQICFSRIDLQSKL